MMKCLNARQELSYFGPMCHNCHTIIIAYKNNMRPNNGFNLLQTILNNKYNPSIDKNGLKIFKTLMLMDDN